MTNWIILIVAGFFESCFAFCLGKMKGVVGLEYYFWGIGFLAYLALSMILLAKAAGMLETFLREPTVLTDDDVMELLTFVFHGEAVQKKLNMLIEKRKETGQPDGG